MNNIKAPSHSGLTLVEVLVATSIILVFLLAFFGAYNLYLRAAFSNGEVVKAIGLAEEGVEALRFIRDSSWSIKIVPLSLDTDYYLIFQGGEWQTSSTNIFVDNLFERKVRLSAVYRDASRDIVSSGGTLDPDTRLVISSVSWLKAGATTTKSISTYLTNIFAN